MLHPVVSNKNNAFHLSPVMDPPADLDPIPILEWRLEENIQTFKSSMDRVIVGTATVSYTVGIVLFTCIKRSHHFQSPILAFATCGNQKLRMSTGKTYEISGETTEWEDIMINKGIKTRDEIFIEKGLNPEDVSR